MSRPPQSPAEAASLHLRLVRSFKTTWFQQYMQYFWDSYYDDNDKISPIEALNPETGGTYRVEKNSYATALFDSLHTHVNESETVFVTEDIVHVVETMSKGMPPDMILPDDVPFEDMLIVFERDIIYEEALPENQWKRTRIRAVQIAKNQPVRSWGGQPARGIMITLFAAVDVIQPHMESDPDLVVIDMTGWKFEQMWQTTDKMVDQRKEMWGPDLRDAHTISPNVASVRKFLLTLFRFMAEEIVIVTREPMSRAQKRRAARENFHIPEDGAICTVHLRKVRYVGEVAHTDTPTQWTHRWWVAGHVRHLDHLEPGRTTWIRPYVKGPEWLPIVMKQRVTAVNR